MSIRTQSHHREPVDLLLVSVPGLLLAALWAATGLLVQRHTQLAPLHYTIYFGIDLTAAPNRLYLLPGFGTFVWIFHIIAAGRINHPAWRQSWHILGLLFVIFVGMILAALTVASRQP
jgi:hypothetical protein